MDVANQANQEDQSLTRTILAVAAACLLSFGAAAETVHFTADMGGTAEVPPKTTEGKGTVTATLDTDTKVLTYDGNYTGLSGPATAAHFHGPALPGANAPVIVPFNPPTSPIHGTATLTDAQMADVMAGKWYANVHTAANPAGEIRGQLEKK